MVAFFYNTTLIDHDQAIHRRDSRLTRPQAFQARRFTHTGHVEPE